MNLRLDRLASLYLVHPFQKHNASGMPRIPILMYHGISDEDEGRVHPYYRTATAPRVFAEHLSYLAENGYSALNLRDAVRRLNEPPTSRKYVVITFDDGYADMLNHASPLLAEHGYTATVFLPTKYIGATTQFFKTRPCLTWSQINTLCRAGITFGSHTVTHPRLELLSGAEIEREIADSKHEIEDRTGFETDSFAYPYAFPETQAIFRRLMRELLNRAGYLQGVCTSIGTEDGRGDRMFLKRLPMNSCDDPALFAAKLCGAYDWLAQPQRLAKMIKSRFSSHHFSHRAAS